jgi:hypothetical protein
MWMKTNFIAASSTALPSTGNGAYGAEKLLLETQESDDFAY